MYGWIYDLAKDNAVLVNADLHRIVFREGKRMKAMTGDYREDLLWNCARKALKECKSEINMEYVEDAIMSDADKYISLYKEV